MALFTDPNDPTNTYGQAIKNRLAELVSRGARAVGGSALGAGTANDATAAGMEAYRQHVIDAAQNGRDPMTREEFFRSQQAR